MIEQLIEKNIIDAVDELDLDGLAVFGVWQPVGDGVVKLNEGADAKAVLVVKVSPRTFDTFTVCECTFEVQMSLVVRLDCDANGTSLITFADGIISLLTAWNLDVDADFCGRLSVDGFDASGINVGQTSGPEIDRDAGTASISFSFTLKGSVSH